MRTTGTERARRSRDRHKAEGFSFVTFRASPATVEALKAIKGHDDTIASVVGRLIRSAAKRKELGMD